MSKDKTVLIMANYKHKQIGRYRHVSLVEIGSKTLLEKQIDSVQKMWPKCKIVIMAGHEAHRLVERFGGKRNIKFMFDDGYDKNNSFCGLSLYLSSDEYRPGEDIFVMDADLFLSYRDLRKISTDYNFVLFQEKSYNNSDKEGVLLDDDGRVSSMAFGLPKKTTGCYYLKPKTLKKLSKIKGKKDKFIYEILDNLIDREEIEIYGYHASRSYNYKSIRTIREKQPNENLSLHKGKPASIKSGVSRA